MRLTHSISSFVCVLGCALKLSTSLGCWCESNSKSETNASNILDSTVSTAKEPINKSTAFDSDKPSRAPSYLRISDPAELRQYSQFEAVRHLDLSPSISDDDSSKKPAEEIGEFSELACSRFSLDALAKLMPDLLRLRIRGCEPMLSTGLAAFASSLQALELVEQSIDEKIAQQIGQLEQLEDLRLSRVAISEPALSKMQLGSRLDSLVLRDLDTNDQAIESWLGRVSRSLSEIELEGPWVKARIFDRVEKMGRLRTLTLTEPSIGTYTLSVLQDLHSLQHVRWSGSKFNDTSPLFVRDLPIESIHCNCPDLGDLGLHHLRYLKSTLRDLSLEQTKISPEGFAGLRVFTDLKSLTIRDSELGETAFAAIASLEKLKELNLVGGTLLATRSDKLALMGKLRRLSIQSNNFGDDEAEELSNLGDLEILDLSRTQISDAGLQHLSALKKLRILKLHHTRITARGIRALSELRQLEVLELDHTDLVDKGVRYLADLDKLRELRLDHTLITNAALSYLNRLYSLERINLAGTVVTDSGIASLQVLPRLTSVNVAKR